MKASIVNAYIDEKVRTCYVTYSTGTEKLYPAYKLPKTVKTWLEDHEPDETMEPDETLKDVEPVETGNAFEIDREDETVHPGAEDMEPDETVEPDELSEIVEPVETSHKANQTMEPDEIGTTGQEDHAEGETLEPVETLEPEEPKILNVDMCQGYVCLTSSDGKFKSFGVSNVPDNVLTWLKENKPDEFREWAKGYKILFMSNSEIISEIYQNRIKELKESETMETSPSPEGKPSEGLPENKTPYQTQNKARRAILDSEWYRVSKDVLKSVYGRLSATGRKIATVTPKVLNLAGLILAAVALTVIDLVSWLLPIVGNVGLSVASVTWGLIEDVLPYWLSEMVRPKVLHAGKEVIKASAILAYMIRVAMA